MNIPPCLMRLYIVNSRKRLKLWLPLFLLWLPILLLALVLLPLIAIAFIVALCSGRGRIAWNGTTGLYSLFCSLRGLKLDIEHKNERFLISMH